MLVWNSNSHPTWAVWKTDVSRRHGRLIEALPETPYSSQHYRVDGFEEGSQLVPNYAERCQSFGKTSNMRFLVWVICRAFFIILFNSIWHIYVQLRWKTFWKVRLGYGSSVFYFWKVVNSCLSEVYTLLIMLTW